MIDSSTKDKTNNLSFGEISFLSMLSILVLITRLIKIDFKTFSIDEVYCIFLANQPWKPFFHMLVDGPAGRYNLYFVFLKIIHEIFGTSHFTMRISSAIASSVMIFPFYYAAKFFTGKYPAILSTTLFAFSPLTLYYGQDARQYSFMFLFISIYILVWSQVLKTGRYFTVLYTLYIVCILIHPINYYFGFAILISTFLHRRIKFSKKDAFLIFFILTPILSASTYIHFKQFSDPYWNVLTPEYKINFNRFMYIISFLISAREWIALLIFALSIIGIYLFRNINVFVKTFVVFFIVPLPIPLYIAIANFFPHNFGSRYLSFIFPITLIGFANAIHKTLNLLLKKFRTSEILSFTTSSILILSLLCKDWITSYKFIYLVPIKATEGTDYRRPLEYIASQNENFPVLIDPFRNVESRFYFYYFMYLKPIDEKRQIISFRYFDNFMKKVEKIGINLFVKLPLTPEKFRDFDWSKYNRLGWFIPFFWVGFKGEPFDTIRFFRKDDWEIYNYVIEAEKKFKKNGYKTKLFYNAIYIEHEFDGTLENFLDKVLEVSEIFFNSLSDLKGTPHLYNMLVVYETFERAKAYEHLSKYTKTFKNLSSIYKLWWEKVLSKE